jgi:LuxR family transcriptional regulator, maltose regulon positive regulatory protein
VPELTDVRVTPQFLPPHHVPRPRLRAILESRSPLTLLSAGPGAGKSVLLGEWAQHSTEQTVWLNLSPLEAQPEQFWGLLTASLRHTGLAEVVEESRASPGAIRGDGGVDSPTSLSGRLVHSPVPITIVVDGAHLILDPGVLAGLDRLVGIAGGAFRLILSARYDPLLPLHRYRLAGLMREIRMSDLAMTSGEVEALLAKHELSLPAAAVQTLIRRTEGWAAGVRLAALRMEGSEHPAAFISELAVDEGSIGEYLIEEVLARQPERVRTMLVQTSFLPEVTGGLASAITGLADCTRLLEECARTNSFVIPTDHTRTTFRYHQLFRDTLKYLLEREAGPGLFALYRRAAEWYEARGDLSAAVAWAARDPNPVRVAPLLTHGAIAQAFVDRSRITRWGFRELPSIPEVDFSDRRLIAEYRVAERAVRAMEADGDDAVSALDQPIHEEHLDTDVRVSVDLTDVVLGQKAGDPEYVRCATGRFFGRDLRSCVRLPVALRGAVLLDEAMAAFWLGSYEPGEQLLGRAMVEAERVGDMQLQVDIVAAMALVDSYWARTRRAEALALRAEVLVEQGGLQQPAALELAGALQALMAGDVIAMDRRLQRTLFPPGGRTAPALEALHALLRAFLLGMVGQYHAALGVLHQPTRYRPPPLVRTYRDLLRASFETELGRPRTALEQLHDYSAGAEPMTYQGNDGLASLTAPARAYAHAMLGELHEADVVIASLFTSPQSEAGRYHMVDGLVCAALVADLRHREARAVDLLERALQISDGEIAWPMIQRTDALAHLLGRHPTVAVQWPAPIPNVSLSLEVKPADGWLPEPLTTRERAVLRLLATNMSTSEIATEMCLSVNTIKTHVAAIYRKLATRKRRETVVRAREMELL